MHGSPSEVAATEMVWHVTLGVAILLDFVGSHQEIMGNPKDFFGKLSLDEVSGHEAWAMLWLCT